MEQLLGLRSKEQTLTKTAIISRQGNPDHRPRQNVSTGAGPALRPSDGVGSRTPTRKKPSPASRRMWCLAKRFSGGPRNPDLALMSQMYLPGARITPALDAKLLGYWLQPHRTL